MDQKLLNQNTESVTKALTDPNTPKWALAVLEVILSEDLLKSLDTIESLWIMADERADALELSA